MFFFEGSIYSASTKNADSWQGEIYDVYGKWDLTDIEFAPKENFKKESVSFTKKCIGVAECLVFMKEDELYPEKIPNLKQWTKRFDTLYKIKVFTDTSFRDKSQFMSMCVVETVEQNCQPVSEKFLKFAN